MSGIAIYLDDTPGETRGVAVRNGRFEHLIIQSDRDVAQHRLGARSVGRIVDVQPGMKGAFVDLGAAPPLGFLPFGPGAPLAVGQKLEVEVTAEPRAGKGPTLRGLAAGEGEPRLLAGGPSVEQILDVLAPGQVPVRGLAAIQAGLEAEEEALGDGGLFGDIGLDVCVQRTRALIAVDLDLAPGAGRGKGGRARDIANRHGLIEAARLIRLKSWGGLVAIDLIGVGHDGAAIMADARAAFGADKDIVYGPVNRFGVLQLALPWRRTPLEERLAQDGPVWRSAVDMTRALRRAVLLDTGSPQIIAACNAQVADAARPLIAALGPRAALIIDSSSAPGQFRIDPA
ncbi:RNA-binding protein [Brevundimonas sp.]|uniref:RNA-binding protein n=1 Tax=Brevundimonas sp. TaxID=1871086 RepID=UPI0035B3C600